MQRDTTMRAMRLATLTAAVLGSFAMNAQEFVIGDFEGSDPGTWGYWGGGFNAGFAGDPALELSTLDSSTGTTSVLATNSGYDQNLAYQADFVTRQEFLNYTAIEFDVVFPERTTDGFWEIYEIVINSPAGFNALFNIDNNPNNLTNSEGGTNQVGWPVGGGGRRVVTFTLDYSSQLSLWDGSVQGYTEIVFSLNNDGVNTDAFIDNVRLTGQQLNDIVLMDFNETNTPGFFTFGGFDAANNPTAVTDTPESSIFDVTAFGGIGADFGDNFRTFSNEDYELVVRGKTLPGNEAANFSVVLVDDDGNDSSAGTGDEEYFYAFETASFGSELTEVVRQLGNGGDFRQQGFNSLFDGDMIENYGLKQVQIQSADGSTDRLNVEIDRVFLRVIGDEPEPCPADTNGDGVVSPADFNAWIIAFNMQAPECDQNGDMLCTPADFNAWIINFNAGCP